MAHLAHDEISGGAVWCTESSPDGKQNPGTKFAKSTSRILIRKNPGEQYENYFMGSWYYFRNRAVDRLWNY